MHSVEPATADLDESDGHRTGATWVAATGAFLLLASAAVFVATRWSDIPHAAKLGVLVLLTGGCIYGGDRLRATLPATGNALFHLGFLLVPVNGAALGVHAGLDWRQLLLANGALATVAMVPAARRAHSVVLAAAASAGVVATCCGLAALTVVPAPLCVALAAVLASYDRRLDRHALAWASAAALAPIAAVALDGLSDGRGVASELGVLDVWWPWSALTGAVAFAVIARCAHRRDEPAFIVVGAVGVVAHGIAAWSASAAPLAIDLLVLPSAFLLLELAALVVRRDPFWSRPAHVAGVVAEAAAALPTMLAPYATLVVLAATREPDLTLAALVGACAWVVAGARRDDGWWASAPAAGGLVAFAVATATGSAAVVAVGVLALASITMLLGDRARIAPSALALAGYGALVGLQEPLLALPAAAGAAAVFGFAALRSTGAAGERTTAVRLGVTVLAVGEVAGGSAAGVVAATLTWAAGCWALALVEERVDTRVVGAGDWLRGVSFGALLVVPDAPAIETLPLAWLLTTWCVVDAFRTRRLALAYAAVVPMLVTELLSSSLIGLDVATAGLVLCVASSCWLGLAAVTPEPWRRALAAMAAANTFIGMTLASVDPATLGPALVVTGALAIATGLVVEHTTVVHLGGLALTLGCWIVLATNDVVIAEAYVVPVALHLLGAGMWSRHTARPAPSSWIAYGAAVALLAGTAVAERIGGGSPWHSVFAGAVGVIAVVAGGSRRLVAPMMLGTATLIVVVGRESLDAAAGLPTWAWLAAGGATLIGAAMAMERHDVSPIEAGRRVVDVIGDRFE
jgi:hypothetical protein